MVVNHLAIERCCNFGTCRDIRYQINCHYQTEDSGDEKERNQIMSQAGFKLPSPVLTLTAGCFPTKMVCVVDAAAFIPKYLNCAFCTEEESSLFWDRLCL